MSEDQFWDWFLMVLDQPNNTTEGLGHRNDDPAFFIFGYWFNIWV